MAKYNEKTPLQWVMQCREFSDETMADAYCKEFDSKGIEELTNDIRRYQHQIVYGRGKEGLLSSSTYYLSRKDYQGWAKMVKYLKYPILVSSTIEFLSDSSVCVNLFHAVAIDKSKESVFISMLLRQRWLDIVCRNVVSLDERAEALSMVKVTIDDFCRYFTMENMCIWVTEQPLNLSARIANDETLYTDFIVNSIYAYVHSKVDGEQINLSNKRLNYLLFVAEPVIRTDRRINVLWEVVVETISTGKFYWRKELNINTLNDFRIVSSIITKVYKDIPNSVLKQFATKIEGYGIGTYEHIYNSFSIESFMLSSLLMAAEREDIDEEDRIAIFNHVTRHLLKQCHACHSVHIVEDYFYIPLMLAELIASQILPKQCIVWENNVVNSNMPLRIITKILCAGKNHDASILSILSKRKTNDWDVEKVRLEIMKTKGKEIIKTTESNFVLLGI